MFKLLSFSLLLSTATAFCPLNSALSGSRPKCFAFYNYPLTFDQADTFCYNLGGRLASITDAFESATISSQVRADSPTVNAFWIGARSVDNRTYTWADGTPFTYQRWASGWILWLEYCEQALGEPRYPCGVVQLSSSSWLTEQCPTMLPFACALDPSGTNPPCESGWSWRQPEAACYKIIRNFDTFDSAENGCKSIGAHLASIHTSSENDWIYDQGTANYKLGVTEHDLQTWIGLKRDCQSCQWYWTDGSALNYTQWTKDEPADDYSNQNCVEIYTDDATGLGSSNVRNWNNVKCDNAKRNAICKKPQNR